MGKGKTGRYFLFLYLSFLVLTVVPLVLTTTYGLTHFSRAMEEEVRNNSAGLFGYINKTLDLEFIQIEKDLIQLLTNRDFIDLQKKDSSFPEIMASCRALQPVLTQIKSKSDLVHSLYLYFPQIGRVLTHNSTSHIDSFLNRNLLMDILNKGTGEGVREIRDDYTVGMILDKSVYALPRRHPVNSDFPRAIICLNIDIDALSASLKDLTFTDQMDLQIRSGGIIARTTPAMDDRRALTFDYVSSYRNWVYRAVIPASYVSRRVAPIRRLILLVVLLIITADAFLSYYISKRLYNPISRILDEIRGSRDEAGTGKNELDEIEEAINRFMETNQSLQNFLEQQRDPIGSSLFRRLFEASYLSEAQIKESLKFLRIDSGYVSFSVIATELSKGGTLKRYALSSMIKEWALPLQTPVFTVMMRPGQVHILLMSNLSGREHDEMAYRFCLDLNRNWEEQYGSRLTFGLGPAEGSISLVSHSFDLANRALAEKFLQGKKVIIRPGDLLEREEKVLPYPLQKISRLVHLTLSGQEKEMSSALDEMFLSFDSAGLAESTIRAVLIQFLMTLSSSLSEKNITLNSLLNRDKPILEEMESMGTMEEISQWLKTLITALSREIIARQTSYSLPVEAALNYIDDRYRDNISLTDVADQLGISSQHLSKKIKEETGRNYVDILNERRLEEAKTMLETTGLTVKEIARRNGFTNAQYFIKRYKARYGLTPAATPRPDGNRQKKAGGLAPGDSTR